MRAYLTAHAAKQHERHFGWKTFRVLTITTDHHRTHSMKEALRQLHVPHSMGASLFLFATRDELRTSDPLTHTWSDGNGRGRSIDLRNGLREAARTLPTQKAPVDIACLQVWYSGCMKKLTITEFARMGGKARAKKLSQERLSEIGRMGGRPRLGESPPTAGSSLKSLASPPST